MYSLRRVLRFPLRSESPKDLFKKYKESGKQYNLQDQPDVPLHKKLINPFYLDNKAYTVLIAIACATVAVYKFAVQPILERAVNSVADKTKEIPHSFEEQEESRKGTSELRSHVLPFKTKPKLLNDEE
jgi:hypothetical protein